MVYRVHRYTAGAGADTSPTVTSGLTHHFKVMVAVADNTYSCIAIDEYLSQFAGRHFEDSIFIFFIGQLGRSTCATYQFAALARLHFHVMDICTEGHMLHLKRITNFGRNVVATYHYSSNLQALWGDDISLF